ncbi:MAG TPA: GNAT family N-acetyltransferase [Candidatus Angelobacter sp.]|nr:GNAT family N-acetyltransferase [Candidatus Angelobacter sp.]
MSITLRPYQDYDRDFLFKVYASTRADEIAPFGWPPAQQEAFLRMQFTAQQQWYSMSYAQAVHHIIELDGAPIGRLMVARAQPAAVLVDIALLPEHRGKGIGGQLIRDLIQQCNQEKLPLQLQVLRTNPALRLYERLGFIRTGEDQIYVQMERQPG